MLKQSLSLILLVFVTQPTWAETVTVKLASGALAVRQKAALNSKSCGKIKNGQKVEKVGESNGWFKVKINQKGCPKTAWIYGYYTDKYYKGSQKMSYLQKNWKSTTEHEVTSQPKISILDATGKESIEVAKPSTYESSELADGDTAIPVPVARPEDLPVTPAQLTQNASKLSAADYEVCKFMMSDRNQLDPTRTKNCWELMKKANRGEIPKDALVYSLKYLKANLGRLKDASCIGSGSPKGIKNSCQFVMNDMNTRIAKHRSPSYFIDLCHAGYNTAGKGLVVKSYVNRGTGSSGGKYNDRSGAHTTIVGAFVTGEISPFIPYKVTKSYYDIGWKKCFKRDIRGRLLRSKSGNYIPVDNVRRDCPVLRLGLYGAQSSNNSTDSSKPMHTSPYQSSIGCPSINKSNNWMMLELNKRGPSLVMNYGPKKYHSESSLKQCKND